MKKLTCGIHRALDHRADASRFSQDDKLKTITRYERNVLARFLALAGGGHCGLI